jgi:hypothetical protein
MLQNVVHLLVRGERPTRAALRAVRKSLPALRQVTGRWGGTRAGLQGAVTRWSGGDSSLGSEWWRPERRTRPVAAGNVLSEDIAWWMKAGKPRGPWTCLSGSGNKIAVDDDHGKTLRRPAPSTWGR